MERIYLDGRHYDRMWPRTDDIEFYVNQARMFGGPVLELACGTGRILEPLARAGFASTGIDRSPGMLAEARRKAQVRGTATRYIEADIRRFSLDERFALIFIAGNSICHLLDIDSFDACIACVRRHLAEGGRFVIDVYMPDLRRLLIDPEVRQRLGEYEDPDGAGRVVVTHTAGYDAVTQINSVKTFHRLPDAPAEVEGSFELKMYFPQELQGLLRHNGLRLLEACGEYDGTALTNASSRQIYTVAAA